MATHHTHVAFGLLAGAATGVLLGYSVETSIIGAVVAGGAALLPDVDTPTSAVSSSVGWAGTLLLTPVRIASVRHRGLTHTLAAGGVASTAVWATTWSVQGAQAAVAVVAAVVSAFAVRSLLTLGSGMGVRPLLRRRTRRILTVGAAVASAGFCYTGASTGVDRLIPLAFAAGYLSHLLVDAAMGGVPLLWPLRSLSRRVVIGRIRTGGATDHLLGAAALALTLFVLFAPHS